MSEEQPDPRPPQTPPSEAGPPPASPAQPRPPALPPFAPINYAAPFAQPRKGPSALKILLITFLVIVGIVVVLVGTVLGACLLTHK